MNKIQQKFNGFFVIGLVCFVAFLFFFVALSIGRPPLLRDALVYNETAVTLLTTGVFSEHSDAHGRPVPSIRTVPGYQLFLTAIYSFTKYDGSIESIRKAQSITIFLQVILAVLSVIFIANATCAVVDSRSGLIALILGALYIPYAINATVSITETLNLFLISVTLALGARMFSDLSNSRFWLYGFCATGALSVLVRPVVALWLFVPLVLYVWTRRADWRVALRTGAFGVGIMILIMSPWIVRNALTFHQFQPLAFDPNLLINSVGGSEFGTAEEAQIIVRAKRQGGEPKIAVAQYRIAKALRENPREFLMNRIRLMGNIFMYPTLLPVDIIWELNARDTNPETKHLNPIISSDTFLPASKSVWFNFMWQYSFWIHRTLIVLAFLGLLLARKNPVSWLLASMIPYYLVMHGLIVGHTRFMYPTTIVLVILSSVTVSTLSGYLVDRISASRSSE